MSDLFWLSDGAWAALEPHLPKNQPGKPRVDDRRVAAPLVEAVPPSRRLVADKAYDADHLRERLRQRGTKPVIPGRGSRAVAYPLDRAAYRRRNVIERMFGWLKNWRRIATRYDRLSETYLAAIALVAAVTQWVE